MKCVSPAACDHRPPFAGKLFPSATADIFASGVLAKQARCVRAPAKSAPRLIIYAVYAIIADGSCCDVVCTTKSRRLYDFFRQRSIIIKITATECI